VTAVQRTAFLCNLGTPASLAEAQTRATASVADAIAQGFFPESLEVLPDVTADGVPIDGLVLLAAKAGMQEWPISAANLRVLQATPSNLSSVVYAEGVAQASGSTPSLRSLGWMAIPIGGAPVDVLVLLYTNGVPPSETMAPTGAALSALDVSSLPADGSARFFVATFRDYFVWDPTSTATVNGTDVLAANGPGRWLRTLTPHPTWTAQKTYEQDAINGNDENTGLPGHAVLTTEEVARRLRLVEADLYVVSCLNGISSTDRPRFAPKMTTRGTNLDSNDDAQTNIILKGTDGAPLASGSILAIAATAPTPAPGVQLQLTSSIALGTFVGKSVRMTSGVSLGAVGKIGKDLGANVFRIGEFAFPNTGVLATLPGVGDTFDVVNQGLCATSILYPDLGDRIEITVQDFRVNAVSPGLKASGVECTYQNCEIISAFVGPPAPMPSVVILRACSFHPAALTNMVQNQVGTFRFRSGCVLINSRVQLGGNAFLNVQATYLQGSTIRSITAGPIQGGQLITGGLFGVFDSPVGEAGVALKKGEAWTILSGGSFYGSGNAVAALDADDGSSFIVDPSVTPTATGPAGVDIRLEGSATPNLGPTGAATPLTTWGQWVALGRKVWGSKSLTKLLG
jgi:hypothetical protein